MPSQAYLYGYTVPKINLNAFLDFINEYSSHEGFEIFQGVNADLIAGEKHFLSALWHTRQAFAAGRNTGKKPAVELVRFLSCQRQISIAFQLIGVKDSKDPQNVALVIVGEDISQISDQINQKFLDKFDAQRNDAVLNPSDKKLQRIAQTFWHAKDVSVSLEDLLEYIAATALNV
ncbi:MAG: KEOPS complex subunit Cgi121 [Candidatus Hermodarchaeota archaeon]